jgi:hypothetical protein
MIPGDLPEEKERDSRNFFLLRWQLLELTTLCTVLVPTTGSLRASQLKVLVSSTGAELKLTKYSGVTIANQVAVYTGRTLKLAPSPGQLAISVAAPFLLQLLRLLP